MIVSTYTSYSYETMISNINLLQKKYPFLTLGYIGTSVLGNSIPFLKIGTGKKEIFYSASYHANEWITSVILMKFIEDLCEAYHNNTYIYGYDNHKILNNCSIYIVPMVNPDGVNLVTNYYPLNSIPYLQAKNIAMKYPNIPFPSGWKANIKGESLTNFHLFIVNTTRFWGTRLQSSIA